jgi:hypothetical protein
VLDDLIDCFRHFQIQQSAGNENLVHQPILYDEKRQMD